MGQEHLGKLQLAIMRVLWSQGESTAAEVQQALEPTHGLAPTTIATMLKKMEAKGVVEHRTDGRRFVYRPLVTEQGVTRTMVADLAERLFDGSAAALVSHLLDAHDVDAQELAQLKERIEAAERARAPGKPTRPSKPSKERAR
ncbi:MAG: BlaI/MecI/CopY family transcriptional regulator [Nannocystaceae bacterium]